GDGAQTDRCPASACRRPPAARSTARTHTAHLAGRWSCIPYSEETLAAYVKKPPPGSVVGGPARNRRFHISQACRWSLMELAPFPCREVAGASQGHVPPPLWMQYSYVTGEYTQTPGAIHVTRLTQRCSELRA